MVHMWSALSLVGLLVPSLHSLAEATCSTDAEEDQESDSTCALQAHVSKHKQGATKEFSCSQCEEKGYEPDECDCGFCGSWGDCTWSCGEPEDQYQPPPAGPQCSLTTTTTTTTTPTTTEAPITTTAFGCYPPAPFKELVEESGNSMCLTWNLNEESNAQGRPCTECAVAQGWMLDEQNRLVVSSGNILPDAPAAAGPDEKFCLEVAGNTTNSNVMVAPCSDSPKQVWEAVMKDESIYTFETDATDASHKQCLDYDNGGSYELGNIYVHDCIGNKANQEWKWVSPSEEV